MERATAHGGTRRCAIADTRRRVAMKIRDVLCAPGLGAYYYDDQAAIRAGAARDGFLYAGKPRTAGYARVRQPAECLSIGLRLEDGTVAWGDALTVQYSGAADREPLFVPAAATEVVRTRIAPRLVGRTLDSFVDLADEVLDRTRPDAVPRSIEYGVSQALLRGVASARRCTMAEVIADDFGLELVPQAVPLFAQSGDDRHDAVDKMLLKRVPVLPHGLINAPEKFGPRGDTFVEYVRWIAARADSFGVAAGALTIHIDLYGMGTVEFGADEDALVECLRRAESAAGSFGLQIETPVDAGSARAQCETLRRLRERLETLGSRVRLVADEWCNTLDDIEWFARERAGHMIQIKMPDVGRLQDSVRAVLACRRQGVAAYLGGSCAETELSAAVAVHVAVATRADMLLAKPAMDVDAALTIVGNEQSRLLVDLASRPDASAGRRGSNVSRA
jgi:methylaspartate ammonia-lyase